MSLTLFLLFRSRNSLSKCMYAVQSKVAKSSSWRGWLGSWRSDSGGQGGKLTGASPSASMEAAVAAAAAATHQPAAATQQVISVVAQQPVHIKPCWNCTLCSMPHSTPHSMDSAVAAAAAATNQPAATTQQVTSAVAQPLCISSHAGIACSTACMLWMLLLLPTPNSQLTQPSR